MKKVIAVASVVIMSATLALQASAQEFKVNSQLSKITWLGKKVTGQHVGTIALSNGTLVFEKEKIAGGKFEIDMNSMTCTDLDPVYGAKLVEHLKAEDFFETAKFPKASFEITSIQGKGEKLDIVGNLTIKGITKSISFPAETRNTGKSIIAVANIPVNRVDYGIKFKSASIFSDLGDKAIDDMFVMNIQLIATK